MATTLGQLEVGAKEWKTDERKKTHEYDISASRKQRIKNFIGIWNTEHVYSSILVSKDLLIPPYTCRKNFKEVEVDVLFFSIT